MRQETERFKLYWFNLPNWRILSQNNNKRMLFNLFLAMIMRTNTSDRPTISLVHVWKSIKKQSSFARKKIQLYWSTLAQLTIQLGGISLKLSPLIGITTTNWHYHQYLCLEAWHINSIHTPLNCDDGSLLPDAYLTSLGKRQLNSDCVKGPLVVIV